MTGNRTQRCKEIFEQAIELPVAERAAFVAGACAGDTGLVDEVDSLLHHLSDTEADLLFSVPEITGVGDDLRSALRLGGGESIQAGQMIDRYKLLEPIGEGGFGVVWAAEQLEPVRRQVALKIIKLGMDTKQVVARFEAERQALAMMDHPNIAKVLDAGSTEAGRPFFVMELVEGLSVVEFCDRTRLDTRARMELFIKICHAIQHAHQKGIIHRDIKPTNVLVATNEAISVPKVIDFGIAKAINTELTQKTLYTQHRQIVGTPAYMSPEQAELSGLDIDTRSDIYSLGVLLYELLSGTTPFDIESLQLAGLPELMRTIREVDPQTPSTRLSALGESAIHAANRRRVELKRLRQLLRGDLDWIVMKCLEKDRARRYETASDLAADIRRHLDHQPVVAGPPSVTYQLKKFIQRNRAQVAVCGLVGLALVAGLIATMLGALDANAARLEAAQRAAELQVVVDFQSRQLGSIVPEHMGAGLRDSLVLGAPLEHREGLRQALGQVDFTNIALQALEASVFEPTYRAIGSRFAEQPLIEARLLQALSESQWRLGLIEQAVLSQQRALAIRRQALGDGHAETLASIENLTRLRELQTRLE